MQSAAKISGRKVIRFIDFSPVELHTIPTPVSQVCKKHVPINFQMIIDDNRQLRCMLNWYDCEDMNVGCKKHVPVNFREII